MKPIIYLLLLLLLTGCKQVEVTITMPTSSFAVYEETGLTTLAKEQGYCSISYQEEADTIVFTMAKKEYDSFLVSLAATIDEVLSELVEDKDLTIAAIEHNEQFDVFNCTLDGVRLGANDHYTIPALCYYALVYNNFCSVDPVTVTINYLDAEGKLIYGLEDTLSYDEWLTAYYLPNDR